MSRWTELGEQGLSTGLARYPRERRPACGRSWIPVRRSWRLNSNHYGALQGRVKAEVRAEAGEQQFMAWRRGFRVRPPLGEPDADPRYAALPPGARPAGSRCTT